MGREKRALKYLSGRQTLVLSLSLTLQRLSDPLIHPLNGSNIPHPASRGGLSGWGTTLK